MILFSSEVLTIEKVRDDIFTLTWQNNAKTADDILFTFSFALGFLKEYEANEITIVVDNSNISEKTIKKILTFEFAKKSKRIIDIIQINVKEVLTILPKYDLLIKISTSIVYSHTNTEAKYFQNLREVYDYLGIITEQTADSFLNRIVTAAKKIAQKEHKEEKDYEILLATVRLESLLNDYKLGIVDYTDYKTEQTKTLNLLSQNIDYINQYLDE